MSTIDAQGVVQRTTRSSQDSRVLCFFRDKTTARPFESALMDCGVSLLRARHGMHAYWLSIASQPGLVIIDARQTNQDVDVLLSRIQTNISLADIPVWVITDEKLPITASEQFTIIPGDILATDLARRVRDLIAKMDRIRQQHVDDYFSLWDDAPATQEFKPKPPHIRTDLAGDSLSLRGKKAALRTSRVGI